MGDFGQNIKKIINSTPVHQMSCGAHVFQCFVQLFNLHAFWKKLFLPFQP